MCPRMGAEGPGEGAVPLSPWPPPGPARDAEEGQPRSCEPGRGWPKRGGEEDPYEHSRLYVWPALASERFVEGRDNV